MSQRGDDDEPPTYVRVGSALLAITEDVIYVGIAVVLAVAAMALLIAAGRGMTLLGGDVDTRELVLEVLDTLLLVFIVVELLFAVRVILGKREVVAEPFLVVGMIASIKEIIVLDQGDVAGILSVRDIVRCWSADRTGGELVG